MLEESPIPSTREEPVLFDTAEIPWWAWVRRFHLPEVRHQHFPPPPSHSTGSSDGLFCGLLNLMHALVMCTAAVVV